MEQTIILRVNGTDCTVNVPPDWSLARTLREKLKLTGTKISCGQGDCGACTVIIDGKAVHSCILPVMDCVGKDILTIEGLEKNRELHFVQKAFLKVGAIQCGYCTPGMVMAIAALYMHNDDPSEEDVKKAISGNLCRCTGYKKIVDVTKEIKRERSGEPEPAEEGQVHRNYVRKDGYAKVTGRAKYVGDIMLEGMLYGAAHRSTRPHARILSINTEKARCVEGVECVLTAADLDTARYGAEVRDMEVLASEEVRYVGEPVALVAAATKEIADYAANLIEVEYEDLPAYFDARESMAEDAVPIHKDYDSYIKAHAPFKNPGTDPKNLCWHIKVHRGNVEDGFAKADYVVEDEIVSHKTHPGYIEPHGAVSYLDENGNLEIIAATQRPFFVRQHVATAFKLPQTKVVVKVGALGGGFGGKIAMIPEPLCAALTLKTGKPIKMIISREEELQTAAPRHKMYVKIKSGIMKDGTVTARKIAIYADAGAYTLDSQGDLSLAIFSAVGAYRYENLEVEAFNVYTNNLPAASNRAPFALPSVFAIETHMDFLAKKIGIDPLEIRRKNILRSGDMAYNGQIVKNCGLSECLEKTAERLKWSEGQVVDGKGKGLSCMWWCSGNFPGAAEVTVNDDGSVQMCSALNEIGTGAKHTAIPQLIAEAMGVEYDVVSLAAPDTSHSPYEHGVGASRMTHSVGLAALECCRQIKEKLTDFMVESGMAPDKNVSFEGGNVVIHGMNDKKIPLGVVAGGYKGKHGPVVGQYSYNVPFPPYDENCMEGHLYPAWPAASFAVQGAVVSRDSELEKVTVEKMVSAMDVGFAINPMAIEGQMEGGMIMGMSYSLMEELITEEGKSLSTSFHDYKIPTAMDIPEMETHIVECYETPVENGPMGARGCAESAIAPAAGAISNALFALTGVRQKDTRVHILHDK